VGGRSLARSVEHNALGSIATFDVAQLVEDHALTARPIVWS
jgi:hypothetical protein